jgi:hypothetical protein
MESERLNDLVVWPLLVAGSVLTLIGLSPLLTALAVLAGIMPAPEGMQVKRMLLSAAFFLLTGLPALLSFVLREKPFSFMLCRVAGVLLLIFALIFPFTLALNVPFFIPLFFYLIGATGIWVLLRNR